MDFLDFEIQISYHDASGYLVEVVRSPAGESKPETFVLPFSSIELENYILSLQNALLRSGNHRRRKVSEETAVIQEFGRILFDALLTGEARSRYYESRNEAYHRGVGLRIKLRIDPPDLATLPWEFLYDGRADAFVGMSRNTPIVRYLSMPSPIRPLAIEPPLRILAMVASPSDQEQLDIAVEKERLTRALASLEERGLVKLDWLEGQTWRDLQIALYQNQYHVFHFVGHGYFNETTEEGMVVFSDRNGRSRQFDATDLARLLADQTTLRLCVLNNCEGAKAGAYDTFSSTAAILVKRGIPAVIAMQYDITDEAAIQMAESFYSAVAGGLPVDAALTEARKGINFALPGSLEWGTPVLFMRASDGRVFDFDMTTALLAIRPAESPESGGGDFIAAKKKEEPPLPVKGPPNDQLPPTPLDTRSGRGLMGIGLAIGAVLLITLIGLGLSRFWPLGADGNNEAPAEVAVGPPADDSEFAGGARPSDTPKMEATSTPTLMATTTPNQVETPRSGSSEPTTGFLREIAGIPFVYVPSGEFEMGSNMGEIDQTPVHTVFLDSYWIMQTEVTNELYMSCVDDGACERPRNDYWNQPKYANYAVTNVTWFDVVAYTQWLSRQVGRELRLPTEAEWEKAARGTDDRMYPWGTEWDGSRLNYCDINCQYDWKDEEFNDGYRATASVGTYPEGAGPYGTLDSAGNVWEWTADWYSDGYYAISPQSNPMGPEDGDYRVIRGGGWYNAQGYMQTTYRFFKQPEESGEDLGFRLVMPDL